ncbi:glycoprotein 3-alpha-L-fucosyltransferase A-like [Lingula anatina]|uniref:Fucosyltransferase n=1 Tax=Lingula anatina TaxID=7574 RepID=A0A1S3KB04_LINAN|nr:glycoprotein 3-alpha-L-fucosyltransferase A-like [Lingula anatina]|eukprot:XP_013419823.1 glycoprotein 3-alpha-L-fucosyltransferase A-like [Lingula anatina]
MNRRRNALIGFCLLAIAAIEIRNLYDSFRGSRGTEKQKPDLEVLEEKDQSRVQPNVMLDVENQNQETKIEKASEPQKTKTVLFWNWNWTPDIGEPLDTVLERSKCPHHHLCKLTKDKRLVHNSDALIFHRSLGEKPPFSLRRPEQRWIWIEGEPPCFGAMPDTGEPYNWTMTYRLDSDLYGPYAQIFRREKPLKKDYMSIVKAKTGLVAWMVSNCPTPSRRMDYVRELQKYIDIDIYGSCGPGKVKCPKEPGKIMGYEEQCLRKLESYKFYLSFENSLAVDYVTEKFFKTVNIDVVAVVRSGANMTRLGFHKDWYINTADFSSPKELADYLKKLDANDALYVKYLEWKNYYYSAMSTTLCNLCERLLYHDDPPKTYTKDDIRQFFYTDACFKPNDIVRD